MVKFGDTSGLNCGDTLLVSLGFKQGCIKNRNAKKISRFANFMGLHAIVCTICAFLNNIVHFCTMFLHIFPNLCMFLCVFCTLFWCKLFQLKNVSVLFFKHFTTLIKGHIGVVFGLYEESNWVVTFWVGLKAQCDQTFGSIKSSI